MQMTSPTTAELRAWARSKGMDVGDRGRLAPEVLAAWQAANAQQPTGNGVSAKGATAAKKAPAPRAAKAAVRPAAKAVAPAASKAVAPKAAAPKAAAPKAAAPKAAAPKQAVAAPDAVPAASPEWADKVRVSALELQVEALTKRIIQLEGIVGLAASRRRGLRRRA